MVLNLPLSHAQAKVLESILATCPLTRDQERLMLPVIRRVRQDLAFMSVRKGVNSLDAYYERLPPSAGERGA